MRLVLCLMLCLFVGCVQIDGVDDPVTPIPKPDAGVVNTDVDQVFLSKILTDATATKAVCQRYAALFSASAKTFRERSDVPAINVMNACMTTAEQFVDKPATSVIEEVKTLATVEKDRESFAKAFDRLSATCLAASLKK